MLPLSEQLGGWCDCVTLGGWGSAGGPVGDWMGWDSCILELQVTGGAERKAILGA